MDGKVRMGICTCLPEGTFGGLEGKTFSVVFGSRTFEFGFTLVPISEHHDPDLRKFRAEGFIDKTYRGISLELVGLRWKISKKGRVYEYFIRRHDWVRYFLDGLSVGEDEIVAAYARMVQKMGLKDFRKWRMAMNPPRWQMPVAS